MNLERLREWLLQNGISEEELDAFIESPIIKDVGEGLTLSLMNDDMIGMDVMFLMMRIDELEQRLAKLEGVE